MAGAALNLPAVNPGPHSDGRRPLPKLARRATFVPLEAGVAMKVTVERAELLKSLGHVHRVVERRNTIPILANVLIRAETGKLSLKATDLDLEVIDAIAAEVSPGGVDHGAGAHVLRHRAQAARGRADRARGLRRPRRRWRSAPGARASPCRRCRKAIFPISPPAT